MNNSWSLAGMRKGTLPTLPFWKDVKCFGALVMTVKRSVDELFMHYFQNIRRLLGASPRDPIGAPFMDPAGGRKPQIP